MWGCTCHWKSHNAGDHEAFYTQSLQRYISSIIFCLASTVLNIWSTLEPRFTSTDDLSCAALLGGRSLSKTKHDITTSIAYPFTLIKPSWEETDVTLNDINQRIRAPPKKPPEILGTSSFSGKPVIGKTRIRTDGGKGSITILRTKGWQPAIAIESYLSAILSIWIRPKGEQRQHCDTKEQRAESQRLPLTHISQSAIHSIAFSTLVNCAGLCGFHFFPLNFVPWLCCSELM